MRSISNNVLTLLSQGNISIFYLIEVGNEKLTSIRDGIVVSGVSYTGDNFIVSLDAPRMSSVVDKESYKITFSDALFSHRSIFESGFSGTAVKVQVGFYNTYTVNNQPTSLSGYPYGAPLNTYNDIITIYSGVVDTPVYAIDMNGDATYTLECSSPMGPLGLMRSMLTNTDYMKTQRTDDLSFYQVLRGSKGIDLQWGKSS